MKDRLIPAALLAIAVILFTAPGLSAQEPRIVLRTVPSGMIGIGYEWRPEQRDGRTEQRLIVRDVLAGSPAETAGVRPGDAVLRLNDLTATPDLMNAISRSITPGDTVRIAIRRDGREHTVRIVAAERTAGQAGPGWPTMIHFDADAVRIRMHHALDSLRLRLDSLRLPEVIIQRRDSVMRMFGPRAMIRIEGDSIIVEDEQGRRTARLRTHDIDLPPIVLPAEPFTGFYSFETGRNAVGGAELTELNEDLARHFPGAGEGLLVLRVAPESPAARAGIRPGDVVVGAGGSPVRNVRDLRRAVAAAGGEPINLEVVRDGARRQLQLSARQRVPRPSGPRSRQPASRPARTAPSTVGPTT